MQEMRMLSASTLEEWGSKTRNYADLAICPEGFILTVQSLVSAASSKKISVMVMFQGI